MKRLKQGALVALSIFLTGCSALNFSVEGLVDAPKLTEEQSKIHEALTNSVGNNITLKYPRNGEHRSAFVIANLDDDAANEAIVFYEYKEGSRDKGIMMNVLDTDEDGNWQSVREMRVPGSEVDKVMVAPLGAGSRRNVIVGYQNASTEDKTLELYSYTGEEMKKIGSDTYSVLESIDIDLDGNNELIAIQKTVNAETETVSAKASLLSIEEGELKRSKTVDMLDNVAKYSKVTQGLLSDGRHALFIDSINLDGNMQTEILYYRYSTLQNPIQQRKEKLLTLCTSDPVRGSCVDIDGDGVIEIPSLKPMTGYENVENAQVLYQVTWNVYKDFYTLEEKYKGYSSGDMFLAFPKRWEGKVTVKQELETGEVVFYKYTGNINTSTTELLRLTSAIRDDDKKMTDAGYEQVKSKGQVIYYVKFPEQTQDQLVLTIDEVKNNFYITDN